MKATPVGFTTQWADRTPPVFQVTRGGVINNEVQSVTVRRTLSGDLPEEVSFVGGSAASSATIVVDTPSSSVHPQTDAATVLGSTVVVRAGFGTGLAAMLALFTGTVRDWSFDDDGRRQVIEAADGSDRLRAPVTLPAFGLRGRAVGAKMPQRYPTNTSAVVVAALHACGIRVTPPALPSCIVSLPLVGGALADIGASVPVGAGVPVGGSWLVDGKFGKVPSFAGGAVRGIPSKPALWAPNARIYAEHWFYYSATAADRRPVRVGLSREGGMVALTIGGTSGPTPGKVWLQMLTSAVGSWFGLTTPGASPALTTGWHRLAFEVTYTGDSVVWLDNTSWTSSYGAGFSSVRPVVSGQVQIDADTVGTVQAVQLVSSTIAAGAVTPTSTSHTPAADVDTGALEFDVVPEVQGRVAWDLLREVAGAELGSVGFGETGRFAFLSRSTINGSTTPVFTIDGEAAANITGKVSTDGIRTRVTARAPQPWFVDSLRGGDVAEPERVAVLDEVVPIPTGTTATFLLPTARPVMPSSAFVYAPTAPGAAYNVDAGIVLCRDPGGATQQTTGFGVGLSVLGPTSLAVHVVNDSGFTLYPVWPAAWVSSGVYELKAGDPAIWVLGNMLAEEDATPVYYVNRDNPAAAATWGDRVLELDDSPWRTDLRTVGAFADAILADLDGPRLILDPITVPADPRRQLADVATITAAAGPIDARIVSIDTTVSLNVEGGMVQILGFRALA